MRCGQVEAPMRVNRRDQGWDGVTDRQCAHLPPLIGPVFETMWSVLAAAQSRSRNSRLGDDMETGRRGCSPFDNQRQ